MAGVPEDALEQFWDRLPAATLNQCEHLLINGIGKALLGKGIDPLIFETEEHMQIVVAMVTVTEEELRDAAKLLCQWLNLKDENAYLYVKSIIPQISILTEDNIRIGTLENLFI